MTKYEILSMVLPVTVGGWPPRRGQLLTPDFTEGGDLHGYIFGTVSVRDDDHCNDCPDLSDCKKEVTARP